MQQSNDIKVRTKLKLAAVQRLIDKHRIVVPAPSRRTLINMCEDGRFEIITWADPVRQPAPVPRVAARAA